MVFADTSLPESYPCLAVQTIKSLLCLETLPNSNRGKKNGFEWEIKMMVSGVKGLVTDLGRGKP